MKNRRSKKDANYNFDQVEPKARMGSGSYANLPEQPIYATFSDEKEYRDGIWNNPTAGIKFQSGINENQK